MITTKIRHNLLKIKNIYLFGDNNFDLLFSEESETDLMVVHGCSLRPIELLDGHVLVNEGFSWITYFNHFKSFDELFKSCNGTSKNSYYQCLKNNFETEHYYGNIPEDVIKGAIKCCNAMFKQKKLRKYKVNTEEIAQLKNNNNILVSLVKKNDVVFCYHIYLIDGNIAELFISCSLFRQTDMSKSEIGKANRFLHISDFNYLFNNSFVFLDWGGLFSNDLNDGIDRFKRSFPGELVNKNTIVFATSFLVKFM